MEHEGGAGVFMVRFRRMVFAGASSALTGEAVSGVSPVGRDAANVC